MYVWGLTCRSSHEPWQEKSSDPFANCTLAEVLKLDGCEVRDYSRGPVELNLGLKPSV